jgi:hypothetical protein
MRHRCGVTLLKTTMVPMEKTSSRKVYCSKTRFEICRLSNKPRRLFGVIAPFAVECCDKEAAALRYCLISVLAPELAYQIVGCLFPSSLSPTNLGHI